MSKYAKIIKFMVDLYQKNILFALAFCFIAIGISGLLYFIPITIIRVIFGVIWWWFSLSIMIASLMEYKYRNKKD